MELGKASQVGFLAGLAAFRADNNAIAPALVAAQKAFCACIPVSELAEVLENYEANIEVARLEAYLRGYICRFSEDFDRPGSWPVMAQNRLDAPPSGMAIWVDQTRHGWVFYDCLVDKFHLSENRAPLDFALQLEAAGHKVGGIISRQVIKSIKTPRDGESLHDFTEGLVLDYADGREQLFQENIRHNTHTKDTAPMTTPAQAAPLAVVPPPPPAAATPPWSPFSRPTELTVPPFDELTMVLFGDPGAGKTTFASGKNAGNPIGNQKMMFFATEPGHQFIRNTVSRLYEQGLLEWNANRPTEPCANIWQLFQRNVILLKAYKSAGRLPFKGITIDIIDNLYNACYAAMCAMMGIKEPEGAQWTTIRLEWERWMGELLSLADIVFLTHCSEETYEEEIAPKINQKFKRTIPTFKGKSKAQFIDGIVNATGYVYVGQGGKRFITFRPSRETHAKDRTGVLELLGELPNDFALVAAAYEAKAKELGYAVRSKHGC